MGTEVDGVIRFDGNSDGGVVMGADMGADMGVDMGVDMGTDAAAETRAVPGVRDELASCKKRCHASLSVRNVVNDLTLRC